ncbi:MAG: crossover junction endodeoxyribonuclease RuvC [Phycisphaerales bacterium]
MRLLGIDPGLSVTGYGCVESGRAEPTLVEAGVIKLAAAGGRSLPSIADRLVELDRDVGELLDRLKPDAAAVEAIFAHYKHPATAIAMGHARGVILLNIRRAGVRLLELRPNEIKKFMTGHGHAAKGQMQAAVQARLRLATRPEPADVADAVAIALCAAWRLERGLTVDAGRGRRARR